jgi:hypothetical protein
MRRPPLAVTLAGCALGGAALGAGGAVLIRGGGDDAPSALPVVIRLPASVLERPQRPADLRGVPGSTPGLRRSSLRRVGAIAADSDSVLLVARDTAGGRCVVAVSLARGLFRAGCVPEPAFASGGARVSWSAPAGARHLAAEWNPDGTVRAGLSRRDQ